MSVTARERAEECPQSRTPVDRGIDDEMSKLRILEFQIENIEKTIKVKAAKPNSMKTKGTDWNHPLQASLKIEKNVKEFKSIMEFNTTSRLTELNSLFEQIEGKKKYKEEI